MVIVPMTGSRTVLSHGCVPTQKIPVIWASRGEHVRDHKGTQILGETSVAVTAYDWSWQGMKPACNRSDQQSIASTCGVHGVFTASHSGAPFPDLQQGAAYKLQDSQSHPVTELLLSLVDVGLQSMQ